MRATVATQRADADALRSASLTAVKRVTANFDSKSACREWIMAAQCATACASSSTIEPPRS